MSEAPLYDLYDLRGRLLERNVSSADVVRLMTSKEFETLSLIGHVTSESHKVIVRVVNHCRQPAA